MSNADSDRARDFLLQVVTIARELPVVARAEPAEGEGLGIELDLLRIRGPVDEQGVPSAGEGEVDPAAPPPMVTARADVTELFATLQAIPEPEWSERIRLHLTALLRPEAVIPAWEEAKTRLFLVLRPLGFFLSPAQANVLARRSLPFLAECVALDFGAALTYVTDVMLEAWGASVDELFDLARSNVETQLEHDLEPAEESDAPKIFRLTTGDAYESSRLISLPWLAKARDALGTDGLLCAAPHRDLLLLATDASPPTLVKLADLAEREFTEADRPVSPALYVFTPEGDLGPLELVNDHPLASRIRRGHVLLANAEYAAQKAKLDEQLAEAEVDLHVATHFAAERDGAVFSYCTWSEVGRGLLPVVDLVAFAFAEEDAAPLVVPFAAVAERVGDCWEEVPELEPTRLRTKSFPDRACLEALAEHAIEL